MSVVEELFVEIDRLWDPVPAAPIKLHLIGSVALMLQNPLLGRVTKDVDVLEVLTLDPVVKARMTALAGRGTELARRRAMYVEIVGNGIPFLPHRPCWIPARVTMTSFELHTLDIVDVFVSKLMRLNANDLVDLQAIVDHGQADHALVVERFRSAADELAHDARAGQLRRIVENLNQVERDILGVAESEIDLPSWV